MSSEAAADDVAVAVRGVGKRYTIYRNPQDRLKQAFWRGRRTYFTDFWALRNVSLDVRRGQSIGIIGRNGSGKSTLLQIIAGTLTPTEGDVRVCGRLAALLELGSGFNPEYTGRENVFLNAAIMGIGREEVRRRFAEIEAFADIGPYIDQPVKTYSSGMFARLAFSVAVFTDPDILIVDEILAVGDMGFQQKCVARMREMRARGLTLLFVSHSPDAVKSVCDTGLFLANGQAVYLGPADQAVNHYLNYIREEVNREALLTRTDLVRPVPFDSDVPNTMRYGLGHVQFTGVELRDETGEPRRSFTYGQPITIEASLRAHTAVQDLSVSFIVRDTTGIDLMGTTTFDERVTLPPLREGETGSVRFTFRNVLHPGTFGVTLAINRVKHRDYSDNLLLDQIEGGLGFEVLWDGERPIHYKFHNPVDVSYQWH